MTRKGRPPKVTIIGNVAMVIVGAKEYKFKRVLEPFASNEPGTDAVYARELVEEAFDANTAVHS